MIISGYCSSGLSPAPSALRAAEIAARRRTRGGKNLERAGHEIIQREKEEGFAPRPALRQRTASVRDACRGKQRGRRKT